METRLISLIALIGACCAFSLHQNGLEKGIISFRQQPEESFLPSTYLEGNVPEGDQQYYDHILIPATRTRRQTNPEPMPRGQRGQISVYGEKNRFGTDFGAQATGRLWESQNGRSTLDANANYQRHFGGPSGTGRPNYGGGITFNHRF